MRHIAARVVVAAPVERVWKLISEYEYWPAWGATVRAVEHSEPVVRAGAEGRVQTIAGFWLPFRIRSVVPARSWDWDVAGVSATGHRVEPIDEETSRVIFTVPWPAAPYLTVLRASLRRIKNLTEES